MKSFSFYIPILDIALLFFFSEVTAFLWFPCHLAWVQFYFPFTVIFTPPVSMKITLHHVVDGTPHLFNRCTRPTGLNTISAEVCSLRSQQEHNSSISGLLLPGQSMSPCPPPPVLPSFQAERMINYTKLQHAD